MLPVEQEGSMTGKEIVNLIDKLEDKGMNSDEIVEIIRYVELTDPHERHREEKTARV